MSNESAPIVVVEPVIVDLDTITKIIGLSTSTVQDLIRKGEFPAPRQMSGRRVGWLLREIKAWAESRPVSQIPPPPNTGRKHEKEAA